MATSFTHLHCHSNFSLLDSTLGVQALVEAAAELDMPAVALTDTNALYGAVEFYERAVQAGIKPIIGAEVVLEDGSSLVLLAKNQTGYENLCDILTAGHLRGGHLQFKLSPHTVAEHAEGLICLSGGKRGGVWRQLRRRNRRQAFHQALLWKEAFGEDFYMELQHTQPGDDFAITYLADLAKSLHVKIVATNDVHMRRPQELEIWRVLRAIDENTLVSKVPFEGQADQYFKSAWQMAKRFRAFPEALENTAEVAEKCRFGFSLGKPIFPAVELPPGETPASRLRALCRAGLRRRYPGLPKEAEERLERELRVIEELGFVEYFLIVKDIVDFCHREGIPCVGRGSAADSLVSYVLGITQVDPIRYDLYFERFLNPERRDPPDIDLDIAWKERERVLQYVYQKYSHDRTAMIATFVTFQLRSSFREIGQTLGLPEEEISRITKNLPHRGVEDFEDAVARVPECASLAVRKSPRANGDPQVGPLATHSAESMLERILRIARHIAGFPRHLSVHPGGTIIAPDRITRYTPLEIAAGGAVISQYDLYSTEKLGLVKMDLLGVRTLSVIADTVREVERRHGTPVRLEALRENDPATLQFIRSAETIGCFQLESPGMRGLLRKMQVDSLDDVIAAISLIRPGPAEGGMKDVYIRRRAGLEEVTYPHPALEPILKSTYGVILYQEQVLLVAQAIAGFSLGEADLLRRAMTKSRTVGELAPLREKFLQGAAQRGIDRATAENLWRWLTHFVGYGFNKAHSATYGMLAYQTAYLKRNFPVEYMTAVLNNDGGFYPRFAYVEEARRMGIRIYPPSVLYSGAQFSVEDRGIRVGLSAILNLRHQTIRKILAERKRRPFRNLYDVLLRTGMNLAEAENLARCGAFRDLEPSEPMALTKIRIFFKNERRPHLAELFTQDLELPPFTLYQRVLNELSLMRFAVSAHPLQLFLEQNPGIDAVPSTELERYKDRRVTVVGWVIASRRVPTAGGEFMKFLTLEDLRGTTEVVLFPKVYRAVGQRVQLQGPLQVTGTVQSRVPGEANLIAERVRPLRLHGERSPASPRRLLVAE